MRNSLVDVVSAALRVLDEQGLENCSMRRVATALGVQPSALYHHVPNKQTLLALMADEIVRVVELGDRIAIDGSSSAATAAAYALPSEEAEPPSGLRQGRPRPTERSEGRAEREVIGHRSPRVFCHELREAMLAIRDGADVVATAAAFRLGTSALEDRLAALVGEDGARTLLLFVFGHTQSTQTHRQAAAFGALMGASGGGQAETDLDASFDRGLDIILAGLKA